MKVAELRFRVVATALGPAAFCAGDEGLRRILLPEKDEARLRKRLRREQPDAVEDPALLPRLAMQLEAYFSGRRVRWQAPIDWRGISDFSRSVYEELARTTPGETLSYGELARRVGRPKAARGVGAAMARNPFPPLVPCHRVLAADGSLRGYSGPGGTTSKARLLELEARVRPPAKSRSS